MKGVEPLFHRQVSSKFPNFPHLADNLQISHALAKSWGTKAKYHCALTLGCFFFLSKGTVTVTRFKKNKLNVL